MNTQPGRQSEKEIENALKQIHSVIARISQIQQVQNKEINQKQHRQPSPFEHEGQESKQQPKIREQDVLTNEQIDHRFSQEQDSHEQTPYFGIKAATNQPKNTQEELPSLQTEHVPLATQEHEQATKKMVPQIQQQAPIQQSNLTTKHHIEEAISGQDAEDIMRPECQHQEQEAESNQASQNCLTSKRCIIEDSNKTVLEQQKNIQMVSPEYRQKEPSPIKNGSNNFLCSACAHKGINKPAHYATLNDFRNRRFLCLNCVTPSDKHILPLESMSEQPAEVTTFMKRITINKNHPEAFAIHKRISEMFEKEVNKKLLSFIQMQNECMRNIKKDLAMQFYAVTNTFNPNIIEYFINKLRTSNNNMSLQQKQQIDIIANALRYSGCRDFSYTDQLQEACKVCFENIGSSIEKEHQEMKKRFDNLDKNFNKYRIRRVYEDKMNAVKNFLEKDKASKIWNKLDYPKQKTNTVQQPITIDIEEQPQSIQKNQSIHSMPINRSSPSNIMMPTSIMKSSQSASNVRIVPQKVTFDLTPKQMVPQTPPSQESPTQITSSRSNKPSIYTVKVTFQNNDVIWNHESRNRELVKRVVVHYENELKRAIFAIMSYKNLQELILFDSKLATKETVLYYLEHLQTLKRIELNCYNDIDTETIVKICEFKSASKIQTFFYGNNYHENMAIIDQKRQFPEDSMGQRQYPLDNQSTLLMLEKMPSLQNIWIAEPNPQILEKLNPNMKYLSFGRMDCHSLQQTMSEQSWDLLSKMSGIVSLSLNKIEINTAKLELVIIRNKDTLKTLVLHECRQVTDHTLTVLKQNALNLKELMLYRCGQEGFKGDAIWELRSLQTLILRQCQNINKQRAQMYAYNLINLKHINLMGCTWLTDEIVGSLIAQHNCRLTSVNFYNTNVGKPAARHLQRAQHIKALNLGATRMKGGVVNQLVNFLKHIKKLSLKNMNGEADHSKVQLYSTQMFQIGPKVPHLTHLDISGCPELQDKIFDFLGGHLKFVNVAASRKITKAKINELVKKGLVVLTELAI